MTRCSIFKNEFYGLDDWSRRNKQLTLLLTPKQPQLFQNFQNIAQNPIAQIGIGQASAVFNQANATTASVRPFPFFLAYKPFEPYLFLLRSGLKDGRHR
jgi:hypothetical protein